MKQNRVEKEPVDRLTSLDVVAFESEVASEKPAPGGGSVSALTGSLAASLVTMVSRLTLNKPEQQYEWPKIREIISESETLRLRLLELVDEDSQTFMKLMDAYRLPRSTEMEKSKRAIEIQGRLKTATEIPLTTAEHAARILSLSRSLSESGNKNALSDVQIAVLLSHASTLGALSNVIVNLKGMKDEKYLEGVRAKVEMIRKEIEKDKSTALAILESRANT